MLPSYREEDLPALLQQVSSRPGSVAVRWSGTSGAPGKAREAELNSLAAEVKFGRPQRAIDVSGRRRCFRPGVSGLSAGVVFPKEAFDQFEELASVLGFQNDVFREQSMAATVAGGRRKFLRYGTHHRFETEGPSGGKMRLSDLKIASVPRRPSCQMNKVFD